MRARARAQPGPGGAGCITKTGRERVSGRGLWRPLGWRAQPVGPGLRLAVVIARGRALWRARQRGRVAVAGDEAGTGDAADRAMLHAAHGLLVALRVGAASLSVYRANVGTEQRLGGHIGPMPGAGLHHPQLRQQGQHGEYHAGPAKCGEGAAVRHGAPLCLVRTPWFCCGSIVESNLDIARIRAITIDLDDTLWPVWPTIERAEVALAGWLTAHAPATAALCGDARALRAIRVRMNELRPDLRLDLSALRRESIRLALTQAGDDPALAEPAFECFFAERQRVDLFDDALAVLEFLSARYPVVAVSNGNADVQRIGIGRYFRDSLSATRLGVAKPDARIFHAAARAAGVDSEAVLHIGDDALLDARGALEAGMQAAWLNTTGLAWPHEGVRPQATVTSLTALCRLLDGSTATSGTRSDR